MITSFTRGRLRLRDPQLTNPAVSAALAEGLGTFPGVTSVTANPRTGSILITYDPENTDMEAAALTLETLSPECAAQLAAYLTPPEEAANFGEAFDPIDQTQPINPIDHQGPKSSRRSLGGLNQEAAEYLGLTAAFAICASSSFLRSKGLHVYSGLTLAGLTLQHLYKHRRRLLYLLK